MQYPHLAQATHPPEPPVNFIIDPLSGGRTPTGDVQPSGPPPRSLKEGESFPPGRIPLMSHDWRSLHDWRLGNHPCWIGRSILHPPSRHHSKRFT